MHFQQFLDSIPILGILFAFSALALLVYELGFHHGRWWQARTPEETEGPTNALVGSLFALMAFLLAIAMGMASERFDARRAIILEEANSIGTTFLRASFLPEPSASQSQNLLREYAALRVLDDTSALRQRIERSVEIHNALWSIAQTQALASPDSEIIPLYIESLNETIDVHETRVTAGVYARVPETVLFLLIVGTALTLGMLGYSAGLTKRRSPVTAVTMILVLGAVISLIVDLDRPRDGFLQVNQQPLIDLTQQLGAPAKPSAQAANSAPTLATQKTLASSGPVFTLYFPNQRYIESGDESLPHLVTEPLDTAVDKSNLDAVVKAALDALKAGPKSAGAAPAFPAQVNPRQVQVRDGVAYVDLAKAGLAGGSLEEGLFVNSVVQTLTGVPGVGSVQFLVEGQVPETLMGHITTSKPISAQD